MNNNIQKTSYDVNINYLYIIFKNHPLLIFSIKKLIQMKFPHKPLNMNGNPR